MPLEITIHPTSGGPAAVELRGVTPELLADRSAAEIARLPILADGRACELGEIFAVAGNASDGRLECVGDFSRVHRIGEGMLSGEVTVHGNAGRHAGERLAGGILRIEGTAGDWLACGMQGGEVRLRGNAGDNAAAALPGSRHGMRGGLVVIHGSVGALAAARLRRGIVAVAGDAGEAAGLEMRAGTLLVGGRAGRRAGLGMQRGSIVALGPVEIFPTFLRGAEWEPPMLRLLAGRLQRAGFVPAKALARRGRWQQWHGDRLAGGRGEILQPAAAG